MRVNMMTMARPTLHEDFVEARSVPSIGHRRCPPTAMLRLGVDVTLALEGLTVVVIITSGITAVVVRRCYLARLRPSLLLLLLLLLGMPRSARREDFRE